MKIKTQIGFVIFFSLSLTFISFFAPVPFGEVSWNWVKELAHRILIFDGFSWGLAKEFANRILIFGAVGIALLWAAFGLFILVDFILVFGLLMIEAQDEKNITPKASGVLGRIFRTFLAAIRWPRWNYAVRYMVPRPGWGKTGRWPRWKYVVRYIVRCVSPAFLGVISKTCNRKDMQGRKQGRWIEQWGYGNVAEGTYRVGKRHGDWIVRLARHDNVHEGVVQEGPYRKGKRHGDWVEYGFTSHLLGLPGFVNFARNGSYRKGAKHGYWNAGYWNPPGTWAGVEIGLYVKGKKHGHWVQGTGVGWMEYGEYVNDKKHGHWVVWLGGGDRRVAEGPYRDDKRHGLWVFRDANGREKYGEYVDGEQHGKWVTWNPDGSASHVSTYHNGILQPPW